MLIIGLLCSFVVTSFEFYFKARRRKLLHGVRQKKFLFVFTIDFVLFFFRNLRRSKNCSHTICTLHYVLTVHPVGLNSFAEIAARGINTIIVMKILTISI